MRHRRLDPKSRTLDGGWASRAEVQARQCRWCRRPVTNPRRTTFCSGEQARFDRQGNLVRPGTGCVHEWLIRSQPDYARRHVWARDRGVCQLCGWSCSRSGWDMDHTIPVCEGGGSCDLSGLRTLCRPCHKRETAALAGRRAEQRRSTA